MLSSFGALFWLHAWLVREKRWWLALPFFGLSVYAFCCRAVPPLLLATALSTLFMLMVLAAPSNLRRYMPYIVTCFAVLVIVYALAVLKLIPGVGVLLDPIAELSGKGHDFLQSRRHLGHHQGAHPLRASPGIGIRCLLDGSAAILAVLCYFWPKCIFIRASRTTATSKSSTTWGPLGLLCLLGYLAYWVRQSLQLMTFDRGQGVLFLGLFFQQAITNLSESTWLAINSAFAIAIVTLATFSLSRSLLEYRLRQLYGSPGTFAQPQPRA